MPVDRETTENRRLSQALSTGPFSLALRLALKSSGLSLDRVQFRLRERDAAVSKTALSNWQSGRTQPERPDSLRALAVLEDIVGVPAGSLSSLLGPPRPRGRWLAQNPGEMRADQAWARPDGLARALERMGTSIDAINRVAKIATHLTGTVDAERRMRTMRHQMVVRAERDGIDRYTGAYRSDVGDCLDITDTIGCRPGRRRQDAETGFTTYELLLDQPARAGELVSVGYTIYTNGEERYHSQRLGRASQIYTVQIQFETGTLPVRVYRTYLPSIGDTSHEDVEVPLGASCTAQHTVVDPVPGIYRLGWDWE
ncbi:hypothetical protein [Actinokineospora xionganensis]|uniref:XRE family transcriptional regulator n=1 Tax=Actinokineospora xionganensis TaxID=2684470 RepID=A0ABR7L656_9PSEU|nr:hypothetical protein [Actinokineospora xionganensis]MBC6448180.1 hypothetical protein [Actinokineospora xionganensis]